ncbi:hypothetical protein RN001_009693 [Aquatica leii]|uniref:Uncharacterized protein n=1 Tax=Aquatica leii TaxID=1421715 RepID=A0AAN7SE05_9COLE|nr:hypothetical protein RN001_009693 [Aquatica leii]
MKQLTILVLLLFGCIYGQELIAPCSRYQKKNENDLCMEIYTTCLKDCTGGENTCTLKCKERAENTLSSFQLNYVSQCVNDCKANKSTYGVCVGNCNDDIKECIARGYENPAQCVRFFKIKLATEQIRIAIKIQLMME